MNEPEGVDRWAAAAPAEAVRDEVRRVLAARRFRTRPTLARLLIHLCESLLAGQTARLREGGIGIDVFGRDRAGFDPTTDAIVRVAATRLRKLLAEHYAAEGRDSTLVIELERGSYVPRVVRRAERVRAESVEAVTADV